VTPDDALLAALRRFDNDRYLTCLFAPAAQRPYLLALYAFNLEIAKTAEVVQEPMLGQIRLQWWREAVAEIYGGRPRRHDVVAALAAAVAACDLPEQDLLALIDAREFDLAGQPPQDLPALEAYVRASSSCLVILALRCLGCEGPAAAAAGEALGLAWGYTGLLRAIPFHARQKRCYLPVDTMEAAGLKPGNLFELRSTPALQTAVASLAVVADAQLAETRLRAGAVPRRGLAALLPAALARAYLKTLRQAGYDPFAPRVREQPPGRVWRLALAHMRGKP
jgi:phytoene synthase